VAGGVAVVPEQLAVAHTVVLPYFRHAPMPSQAPSLPQPALPWSAHWDRGSLPAATFEQVPARTPSAHDRQVPAHAVEQHTPCSQKPDSHSEASVHGPPGGLRPQLPFTQAAGATQSALLVQVVRQLPPAPHLNGVQSCVAPGAHAPPAVHEPASWRVDEPAAQVAAPQAPPTA
jgi:hypothetical protein